MGISHRAWETLKGSDESWESWALQSESPVSCITVACVCSTYSHWRIWACLGLGASRVQTWKEMLGSRLPKKLYSLHLPQPVMHYPDGKTEFCSLFFCVFFNSSIFLKYFFPRLYHLFTRFIHSSLWNDNYIVWVKCQEPLSLSTQKSHNSL